MILLKQNLKGNLMYHKKLLFVVHRYGHPGGSEYNVQRMAEECVRQGHNVTVLADINTGDLNDVKVTNDRMIAFSKWDLIIVHGSCNTQDFIHENAHVISTISPIYYLLVQPSDSIVVRKGMKHAKFIGCGTSFDYDHVKKYGHTDKAVNFRYGLSNCQGHGGFRELAGVTTGKMYISAGGFWPHKRMDEIVTAFNEASPKDTTLVLLGYDTNHGAAPESSRFVKCFEVSDPALVYDAMSEANLLILNSEAEGFGLVLIEAMYNFCPWISRPIAAGFDLAQRKMGKTFNSYPELVNILKNHSVTDFELKRGRIYAANMHSIQNSVKDLLLPEFGTK